MPTIEEQAEAVATLTQGMRNMVALVRRDTPEPVSDGIRPMHQGESEEGVKPGAQHANA